MSEIFTLKYSDIDNFPLMPTLSHVHQVSNHRNADVSKVAVVHAGVTHGCVDRDIWKLGCTGTYSFYWTAVTSGLLDDVAT